MGFEPDACLINRYEPGARLTLHQDRNERDLDGPNRFGIVWIAGGISVWWEPREKSVHAASTFQTVILPCGVALHDWPTMESPPWPTATSFDRTLSHQPDFPKGTLKYRPQEHIGRK